MNCFTVQHRSNRVWYGTFPHFAEHYIKHGVSTRLGGASVMPFASLNLGLHTGDDADAVKKNRKLFCDAVGVELDRVVTAEQIHGTKVAVVGEKDAGKGAIKYDEAVVGADALITNIPNLPLLLFFADCVPVLIVDPVHKAIGVSHAGWKGTVGRIAQKTVLAMQENFGTNPADCLVGIAPSIGPCCYEVDQMVVAQLKQNCTKWSELLTTHGSKWRLDLWLANQMQLEEIGVPTANIVVSKVCTACNTELFFSYRAEKGRTGRIGAIISL